jgi:hypothetical protein
MSYEYQDYLLDLVDELKLHPRLSKIKRKTAAEEWRELELLVMEELEDRGLTYTPPEKTEGP